MATARKLPSGSWRVQVFSHKDERGRIIKKSFTCSDPSPKGKRKCEAMAAAWAAEKELNRASGKTFGSAADEYINIRRNTLSPRTIEDYERTKRIYTTGINNIRIDDITQNDIQKVIDEHAEKLSPKTVANIHCFISAVMRQERPSLALTTSLPQRVKPNLTIPTDEDVKALIRAIRGTSLELPVLLAAFGPMREGEICALDSKNISGATVHVCENMVKKIVDKKTTWIIRHPKSTEGDRFITYPDFVANLWQGKEGRIVGMNPNTLCKAFIAKINQLDIPKFRFHDLRHYSASIQHALGVPDAYIMQRGGWSSDRVLKSVYRHAMADHQDENDTVINNHFSKLFPTEFPTK